MNEVRIAGAFDGPGQPRRRREPLTLGVPFSKGACRSLDRLGLFDRGGRRLPLQTRRLDAWADGSVRWALVDFQGDVDQVEPEWCLRPADPEPAGVSGIQISSGAGTLFVDTGDSRFEIGGDDDVPFRGVTNTTTGALRAASTTFTVVGLGRRIWRWHGANAQVEEHGPIRASVLISGELREGSTRRAQVELRVHFFAGHGTVRFEFMLRNPRRAQHRNGYWDLGDPGSIFVEAASCRIEAASEGTVWCSPEVGKPLESFGDRLDLCQASSGGEHWASPIHMTAKGGNPCPYRGYRLRGDHGESEGLRATPVAVLRGADSAIGLAIPQFWQNFPKRILADPLGLTLDLFPEVDSSAHELQGGEQKTHTFYGAYGADAVSESSLDWCRSPTRVSVADASELMEGARSVSSGGLHRRATDYDRLVGSAIGGESSFFEKREQVDEYGWRHFGELYADHEAVRHRGPTPFVSHYNNQYDAVAAFAHQFLRTADPRWWVLMDDLARHVVDIDIYHTTEDRAAYNGGLFWHTNHYIQADTSTHRSYPRRSDVPGGGPANEHNYTTGLMLHHLLTGSLASAQAVVGLAEWVTAMDDGAQSRFRWIDRGATGQATSTYSSDFHGPGRGAANSVNALLDAHRLTGRPEFLHLAERFIRRCVHPEDDSASFDLLDAERRWSYTVFLETLGKYLDYVLERGDRQEMAAYARATLATYARWMAAHETPYLHRADQLEFPTETWAAQDLRKADVFHTAAAFASPVEQARFLEKRDAFFDYALDALASMPTASCTRPMVLLLTAGRRVAYGVSPVIDASEMRQGAFPPRRGFVPQKQRIRRRLILATVLAGTAIAASMLWLTLSAY